MTKQRKAKAFDTIDLRRRATAMIKISTRQKTSPPESQIKPRKSSPPPAKLSTARYRQELDIHRIELELQNEELRAARVDLEAGLDRYTRLFDFAPIGYATLGTDGIIREINHAGAGAFSERRSRLVGRRFGFLLKSADRTMFDDMFRRVLNEDSKETRDLELLQPGEDPVIIRVTVSILAGPAPSILAAFQDISAEKRAELRLLRADADLREADRRKDEFLAVLSHELRTPLSALLLYGQLLRQGILSEEKIHRAAEAIERAARAQARLIDDLLDVSRIAAGKLNMQIGEVNVIAVVRAAIDSVSKDVERKHIEFIADFSPAVATIKGDAGRLQQAVSNLLTNALKFTPTSGQIVVRLRQVDNRIRIQVEDTGLGIDAQFLPRIFERFTQGDTSTTRRTGGLGLGLSIVKTIVAAHHGTVQAQSAGRGKGSCFTISLPVGALPSTAALAPGAPVPALTAAKIRGARLLIVEDDTDTRETLVEVLSAAGADVRAADCGESATAIVASFRPKVLVCDIAMPNEDGCALLRRLRVRSGLAGAQMRAMALTAFGGDEDQRRTRAAGFEIHLTKPIQIEQLIEAVSQLLEPKQSTVGPN